MRVQALLIYSRPGLLQCVHRLLQMRFHALGQHLAWREEIPSRVHDSSRQASGRQARTSKVGDTGDQAFGDVESGRVLQLEKLVRKDSRVLRKLSLRLRWDQTERTGSFSGAAV